MAWSTPATATAGTILTAAWLNTYLRDNFTATRAGGMAMTTQANGRFVVASSTTQLSPNKNAFVRNFMESMS